MFSLVCTPTTRRARIEFTIVVFAYRFEVLIKLTQKRCRTTRFDIFASLHCRQIFNFKLNILFTFYMIMKYNRSLKTHCIFIFSCSACFDDCLHFLFVFFIQTLNFNFLFRFEHIQSDSLFPTNYCQSTDRVRIKCVIVISTFDVSLGLWQRIYGY